MCVYIDTLGCKGSSVTAKEDCNCVATLQFNITYLNQIILF